MPCVPRVTPAHPGAPAAMTPAAMPRVTYMSYVLIAINIGVFFALQGSGGPTYENLLLFGAKENGLIADGQIGRLFFPMFLHANVVHLGFNMWGLYQVGRYLELLVGPRKLVFLYLLAGVSGNLASFAFVEPLSVGASGSLFGFLSCLWILQKYEEKLAEEMNEPVHKSTLGMLIAFNFVLGFVIPNIDWACHLGGFLAGVFVGLALVMRHKLNRRVHGAVRYLGTARGLNPPRLVEREGLYAGLLVALNLVLALGYFRVGVVDRAFGRGTLAAAENFTDPKPPDLLPQYRALVAAPKSETNPERLLSDALALHKARAFASAALLYDVLLAFNERGIGGEAFVSKTTLASLIEARRAAVQQEGASDDLVAAFGPLPDTRKESRVGASPLSGGLPDPKICLEPAGLLRTLGFFGLAGKLFECAFYLDTTRADTAADTFECYWRQDGDDKTQVQRFRFIYEALQGEHRRSLKLPSQGDDL